MTAADAEAVEVRRRLYPLPSPERRRIVQLLADAALELDAEVAERQPGEGIHNDTVRGELMRAAGALRFVATLIINGSMSERRARFWMAATADYLELVRRADRRGIIR